MASPRKKEKKSKVVDPISDRAHALSDQIAALESQIKQLDTEIHTAATPKLRSTALPHGATVVRKLAGAEATEPPSATRTDVREPVFETVKPVRANDETAASDQFNEFGVRKYDLPALVSRLRSLFTRPPSSNPRLVTYLAAGGVRGLRPLRYEKRVARNRFIALVIILLVILLGIFSIFLRH